MSDARTVRELLVRAGLGSVFPADGRATIDDADTIAGFPLDAVILPSSNAVVALEELEKGAKAAVAAASGLDSTGAEWDAEMDGMWGEFYADVVARWKAVLVPAVLTAMHITVADEVVVVDTFNGCAAWVFTPTPEDGPMPVRLRDGDKLYIVRAKEGE